MSRNLVVRNRRLLLPDDGRSNTFAAEVLAAVWPLEAGVTVLSVRQGRHADERWLDPVVEALRPRITEVRQISSDDVAAEIVAEARLGYGAIVLSAPHEAGPEHLLSAVVDGVVARSPIPVVVCRPNGNPEQALPLTFAKILVPVNGTRTGRAGQEIAGSLNRHFGADIVLTHVVDESVVSRFMSQDGATAGGALLREASDMMKQMRVTPRVTLRGGRSAGHEICESAREDGADIVILSTNVRHVEGRPFFGYTVEQVLAGTDATVILIIFPQPQPP